MKKIRTLGLIFSIVVLVAFFLACNNSGGTENNPPITTVKPGSPDVVTLGPGTTLYDQINWVREHYMLETYFYEGFTFRANYNNEILGGQLDLNFTRPVTITIRPADNINPIISGHTGCTLSTIVVRSGNRLILHDIILQESFSPSRTNALVTVTAGGGALEMTGSSEITGGLYRGVVVETNSSLIMRDNTKIHNNFHNDDGGGVFLRAAGATLKMYDDASIDANSANGRGGGVNAHSGAAIIMRDSSAIHDNTANNGGGVALTASHSRLSLYDTASINNNTATEIQTAVAGCLWIAMLLRAAQGIPLPLTMQQV